MNTMKKNINLHDLNVMSERMDKTVVFVLTATWCEPCHRWMQYLEKRLINRDDVHVVQMDVDIPANIVKELNPSELPMTLVMKPTGVEVVFESLRYDMLESGLSDKS